jgi:hypothetical protein
MYGGFYVLLRHSEQGTMVKFVLLYFLLLLQVLSYSFNEAVSFIGIMDVVRRGVALPKHNLVHFPGLEHF